MTDEELAAVRARNERRKMLKSRATVGPWYVHFLDDDNAMSLVAVSTVPETGRQERWPDFDHRNMVAATLVQQPRYADVADGRWDENAKFIASARNDDLEADVEALLAEVERLKQALGQSDSQAAEVALAA